MTSGTVSSLPTGRSATFRAVTATAPAPIEVPDGPTFVAPTTRGPDEQINKLTSIPFIFLHLLPLLAVFTGVTTKAVIMAVVFFYGRMFFITAGYHRYFSHRSYKLGRVSQFVMAFGAQMSAQKGALWWASHHRDHHKYSDTALDVHSPQRGFLWSHVGWILCDKFAATDYDRIKDFSKFPELRWLNKYDFVPPWTLGIASFLIGGWSGLLIGFFASTVLLWHATFTVNSLNHVWGSRRYATEDTSRNNALMVVWTMGEGWHNNHHYYQASARQGFYWWEIDPTYYVLKALSWVGIVKDLKTPSRTVRDANHIADGAFDLGMFRLASTTAANYVHAAHAQLPSATGDQAVDDRAVTFGAVYEQTKAHVEAGLADAEERAEEFARLTRRGEREIRAAQL